MALGLGAQRCDCLGVPTEGHLGLGPRLQHLNATLLQCRCLGAQPGLVRQTRERRPPPQLKRGTPAPHGLLAVAARQRVATVTRQVLEGVAVETMPVEREAVTGLSGLDQVTVDARGAQRPPQPRHVRLDGLARARRRVLRPQ